MQKNSYQKLCRQPSSCRRNVYQKSKIFFFSSDCLHSDWVWYIHEWQKRGNIHVHGLCRLKSDPDLSALALKVVQINR